MGKCAKSVVACVVLTLMVTLMTIQKTSLIMSLRVVLHHSVEIEAGYAVLSVILLAPYLFSVLLTMWNVPFLRKAEGSPWPPLQSIFLSLFSSVVEAACLVTFTTRVMVLLPVYVALPAAHSTLAVSSVIVSVQRKWKPSPTTGHGKPDSPPEKVDDSSFCWHGARIMASVMCLLVPPAVACFLYVMDLADGVSSLCFGISYLALALCQPLFGVVLPSLFSMVASIVLCVSLAPVMYGIDETKDLGSFSPLLICASVLAWAWAWPYILNSHNFLRRPSFLLTPYKAMFLDFGWNPIFHDSRLLLGYNCKQSVEVLTYGPQKKNRIYICTTMYREADYEMERLLLSLVELSTDPVLQDVHFESNIFMDNGCTGETLNEFALQFIALLVSKAGVELNQARCYRTPYGIQIFCKLSTGLPLFVHLKDAQKVKPKKRWSQCMYINYVMRHRKTLWHNDHNNKRFFKDLEDKLKSQGKDDLGDMQLDQTGQFMLRRVANIGYPTLAEFKVVTDSDQGFVSVDESSPSNSDSGSQGRVYSSSKESSDLDSLSEEKPRSNGRAGYENKGFQDDEDIIHSSSMDMKDKMVARRLARLTDIAGRIWLVRRNFGDRKLYTLKIPVFDVARLIMRNNSALTVLYKVLLLNFLLGASDVINFPKADTTPSSDDDIFNSSTLVDDDHTFILATDADMDFKGEAVRELLDLCNADKRVGAACGRTHPIGKKCSSIVWHQVFEYAKDFWMIKNAQNIIGSVSCCPGCFSLYRGSAIRDVMTKYASPTRAPYSVYVKDTGEDRWMATLMMINGWRMRYSPFADNTTYCPDSFGEYYKQRKRWILSDMANAVLVVQNLFRLIRNNDCFSMMYVVYLVNMFLNNIITPGTAIVMITAATTTTTTTRLHPCPSPEAQSGNFHFQQHYVILLLALSLVYAALMHPRESYQIVYGVAYLFIFPAMHVLLPIYSIANIVDQSWGTRDSVR
ncbi:uncharacterized protein LOC106011246 [Aplysia californica]|uniref:chitin synthase n=1 Tax=Aplysia californica TaxID=6500 RepID=A0ABM1VQF2_APLCA|nr:uncharacterized protein LOC106011246 [Aplysia californica]